MANIFSKFKNSLRLKI